MLGFVSEGAFKQLQACKTSRVNTMFYNSGAKVHFFCAFRVTFCDFLVTYL